VEVLMGANNSSLFCAKQLGNNTAAFSFFIEDWSFDICHCAKHCHRNHSMKNENSTIVNEKCRKTFDAVLIIAV
jgi:hypothetical protein